MSLLYLEMRVGPQAVGCGCVASPDVHLIVIRSRRRDQELRHVEVLAGHQQRAQSVCAQQRVAYTWDIR